MDVKQHRTFAQLRAYPNRQLHRLAAVLRDGALPLDQPSVHALARMALYHLGPLAPAAGAARAAREWWGDWGEVTQQALLQELGALADKLDNTPGEQAAVELLGEVRARCSWCGVVPCGAACCGCGM